MGPVPQRADADQEVPTALMRQGNFSELLGPNIFYSKPSVIYDPDDLPLGGRRDAAQPFPGNIIPSQPLEPERHRDYERCIPRRRLAI